LRIVMRNIFTRGGKRLNAQLMSGG